MKMRRSGSSDDDELGLQYRHGRVEELAPVLPIS